MKQSQSRRRQKENTRGDHKRRTQEKNTRRTQGEHRENTSSSGPTCIREGGEGGGAAEEARGEQLRLEASPGRGALEEVKVWIHGLGLPQVRPLHRRPNTVLQEQSMYYYRLIFF